MKRVKYNLLILLMLVLLVGCSNKTKEEEKQQVNYVVVEAPKNTDIDDLFEFDSISNVMVSDARESLGNGSCYCIGTLSEGDSVVWESGGHLFLYIEDEVLENHQVMSYADKFSEPSISYDSFRERKSKGE